MTDFEALVEEIKDAASEIDRLAAIRGLMAEVDSIAGLTAESWTPRGQPTKLLRMQIDRLLATVSQTVPPHFHNGYSFLLPSAATALAAKEMLFNARMAVALWMLNEWEKER